MSVNLITLFISSVVFITLLWFRETWLVGSTTHARYYGACLLSISGILMLITLCRIIRNHRKKSQPVDQFEQEHPKDQRQHYRLRFDAPPRPLFIQKTEDRQPAAVFTCPVQDISETGISLACTGVYTKHQAVRGEIIFDSGRTAPINGIVVREEKDRTCLHLHCTIDPPLLMAEQREQIVMAKAEGPRPAVDPSMLEPSSPFLPSHRPKGICRLKQR